MVEFVGVLTLAPALGINHDEELDLIDEWRKQERLPPTR